MDDRSLKSKDWISRLKKADIVCSRCKDSWNDNKSGSWRFTGFHWEHHCSDAGQAGHFIGVMRKQLKKEHKIMAKIRKRK
jgi:hypothetical protein